MIRTLLFSLVYLLIVATSCQKAVDPNEDIPTLNARFNGKYRPVQSTASEAVDVNFDGQASVNLLTEISDLATTDLRMDVRGPNKYTSGRVQLFSLAWPEQYMGYPYYNDTEPTVYDSMIVVNYASQGVVRSFTFDSAIKQIQLEPDKTPPSDPVRFAPPESVTIETGDRIRVINKKRIFTRSGWKTVRIETLYERYTIVT